MIGIFIIFDKIRIGNEKSLNLMALFLLKKAFKPHIDQKNARKVDFGNSVVPFY